MLPCTTPVVIAGGGPFGLMLALELGRRGIAVVLVDQDPGTAVNPQAHATQARTMEHYRRLGFAQAIRKLGLPPDFPTDIAYFTRFAKHELARVPLPSSAEAQRLARSLTGSWSAVELPHRCAQKFIEQVLRRHAEALPGVTLRYGTRMTAFRQSADKVEVVVESEEAGQQRLVCDYLVGADGARSLTRQELGIRYAGESGAIRDFVGGRMYAVYARIPDFYRAVPHRPAWMNVCFNPERRAFMPAVDGKGVFTLHTQLRAHEQEEHLSVSDAQAMVQAAVGAPLEVEVLGRDTWTAGHSLVAERFANRRVFIGGDAAHLFTPTGGLGYNTAVEDAVNLGWKLAAVLRKQAAPELLGSYEAERRPLAVRNTAYAKGFADSLGNYKPVPEIEDDSAEGQAARARAGEYFEAHGRAIVGDGSMPPPDTANTYVPSACPGGRAPHLWLKDGRSLFDLFGFEWTLLRLGKAGGDAFIESARRSRIDLTIVDSRSEEARDLYQADLALIRPDQIVAWRGNDDRAAGEILRRLTGHV